MNKIDWNFNNTYLKLPKDMLSKQKPESVKNPELIILNYNLSEDLDINLKDLDVKYLESVFSGNLLPDGSEAISMAYAGHQFGNFTILGDGRAITIGEHFNQRKQGYEIQFKGSGKTKFSRNGDGKAALGPMLREYIISEAMYYLNIPTTRSLAVIKTGEKVKRETELDGAILTRVATSHIRVGTFQYFAFKKDETSLKNLVNYTVNKHFPSLKNEKNLYLNLIGELVDKQIDLIINWMRVGFIHGVMNTDNMALSGETIDYGPCAFMDIYDPKTVFSSIDHFGRYAYYNQPTIAKWNLARFAECLIPFLDKDKNKAIELATNKINEFDSKYEKKWLKMMRGKLGFISQEKSDEVLILDLLQWMHINKADYTNTFCNLTYENIINDKIFQMDEFFNWKDRWKKRLSEDKNIQKSKDLMKASNPVIIPRNYLVEEALKYAEDGNLDKIKHLLKILSNPYKMQSSITSYQMPPKQSKIPYKTYCGT